MWTQWGALQKTGVCGTLSLATEQDISMTEAQTSSSGSSSYGDKTKPGNLFKIPIKDALPILHWHKAISYTVVLGHIIWTLSLHQFVRADSLSILLPHCLFSCSRQIGLPIHSLLLPLIFFAPLHEIRHHPFKARLGPLPLDKKSHCSCFCHPSYWQKLVSPSSS